MRTTKWLIAILAGGLSAFAATAPAAAQTKVVVSIKPLHALVASVMAGVGTPDLLVKGAASPHTYAMKPSDAKALNGADLFFRMSESVEPFTDQGGARAAQARRGGDAAGRPGHEAAAPAHRQYLRGARARSRQGRARQARP